MEFLSFIPWRLISLAAALLFVVVLLLRLLPPTQATLTNWLQKRTAGAIIYCALAVLMVSMVAASRTAPLPAFGRERDLEQALQTATSAVAELQSERGQLQEQLQELSTIGESNESVQELNQTVASLQQRNQELQEQMIPLTERERGLEQALQAASDAVAELENQMVSLSEERRKLNNTIEQRNQYAEELERKLANLQQQNEEPTEQVNERERGLEAQIAELRDRLAQDRKDETVLGEMPPPDAIARLANVPGVSVEVSFGGLEAAGFERGDLGKALSYYEKLANAAIESDYVPAAALAHENLAIVNLLSGNEAKAQEEHQTALDLLKQVNRQFTEMVSAYDLLSIADTMIQDAAKAKEFYAGTALSLAQSEGYMWGIASENVNAGVAAFLMSDLPESVQRLEDAVKIFNKLNAKPSEAMARSNLAVAYDALDENDKAAIQRKEAMNIVRALGQ